MADHEPVDLRPTSEGGTIEKDSVPESPERVAATTAALAKLVEAASSYAHGHDRAGDNVDLKQIDLRAFTDESEASAYHVNLGFQESQPDDQLMLTLETPTASGGSPWKYLEAAGAGVNVQERKIQDFLYRKGESTVPVREHDFSFVYDYRPIGGARNYEAPKPQIDQLIGFLKDAHVMNGKEKGPKVVDLVPELAELLAA
jgi:hypothetical protein